MNNIEQKRATYDKWFKIALVALGALIISPIIFLVVKGIVGLVIAGVIGLVVVNFAPVFSMKLANWKVKGVVAEAKENPIETMVNLLQEKKTAYNAFKLSVENAVTAAKTFETKCKEFTQKYPARAHEFIVQVNAMKELVEKKKQALKQAQAMLIDGDNKLEEMRAYWSMSQAAQEANKAAGMSTGDAFEKLKSDTACDAVFESMNRAFAELEVAAALNTPAIENNASPSLNIVDVNAKVLVQ